APYIVRASVQLAGHAITIYRHYRNRLRQGGELLFEAFSLSLLGAEHAEQSLRGRVARSPMRDSLRQPLLPAPQLGDLALQDRPPVCGLCSGLRQARKRLRHRGLYQLGIEGMAHGVQDRLVQDGLWEMEVVRTDGRAPLPVVGASVEVTSTAA